MARDPERDVLDEDDDDPMDSSPPFPMGRYIAGLCLVVPLNVGFAVLKAAPKANGSVSYLLGTALGAAVVVPGIVLGISEIWKHRRNPATRVKLYLITTVVLIAIQLLSFGRR